MKNILQTSTILILAAGLLLFCGCEKEDSPEATVSDKILYTDLSPDASITSISGWYETGLGSIPIPADSTAYYTIDLNHDSIQDVSVAINTSYYWQSNSNPSANYNFSSWITMIQDSDSVAWSKTSGPMVVAKAFPADSVISDNSSYSPGASTYETGPWFFCDEFHGNTYFGVKLYTQKGPLFGWIMLSLDKGRNKIHIREYAINLTPGRSIKAGQKE